MNFCLKEEINEIENLESLNNQVIETLESNFINILVKIFGSMNKKEIIKIKQIKGRSKANISITYKDKTKYISVRSANKNLVHLEKCDLFENYLRNMGLDEESIKLYLIWHFSDGTTNGKGVTNIPWTKMLFLYQKEISLFHFYLNSNKKLLIDLVDRMLFKGSNPNSVSADYIYLFGKDKPIIISREMVKKYISRKTWKTCLTPHFGPIQFKSFHTKKGFNPREIESRYKTVFWWPNIGNDLKYIYFLNNK